MNAIPIVEAKNRLPFYLRKVEDGENVAISRHNREIAVIISKAEYDEFEDFLEEKRKKRRKKTFVERAAEFRKRNADIFTNEDVERIFGEVRESGIQGTEWENSIFDGIFED